MPDRAAPVLTAVAAVGLVAGGAYVGHTGGQLVYKYGAASAYATPSTVTADNGGYGRVTAVAATRQGAGFEDND